MGEYERFRANQPTVTMRFPELRQSTELLEMQQDAHFDLVRRLCGTTASSGSTPLFDVDIVLLSVLNRSLDLIDGFLRTYDHWNLSTAAPLVRTQVDNLLRVTLVRIAPPNTVTKLLLSGEKLSRQIDPLAEQGTKVKLTDARLRDHARPLFPWLDQVYDSASGWVHFSDVHVGVTMHVGEDNIIAGRFPSDIDGYPFEFLSQVVWAMTETTKGILEVVNVFADGKQQASHGWTQVRADHSGDARPNS